MSEQEQFNTLKNTIIKNVLKEIYKNYTVNISQEDLFNILTNKRKCKSINSKMIQCKNIVTDNNDYCEKHFINNYKTKLIKEPDTDTILYENDSDTDYILSLDKQLIENSFYYIDHKYNCFYDSDYNKVGIIKDQEYIFTTNPFLFDEW